jgi:hypothetical protein
MESATISYWKRNTRYRGSAMPVSLCKLFKNKKHALLTAVLILDSNSSTTPTGDSGILAFLPWSMNSCQPEMKPGHALSPFSFPCLSLPVGTNLKVRGVAEMGQLSFRLWPKCQNEKSHDPAPTAYRTAPPRDQWTD